MDNDRLESDVTSQQAAGETQAGSGVRYVAAAPLIEVLFEQLEYLAGHLTKGEECPSPCPVCARLDLVARHLLAPFRDPFNQI